MRITLGTTKLKTEKELIELIQWCLLYKIKFIGFNMWFLNAKYARLDLTFKRLEVYLCFEIKDAPVDFNTFTNKLINLSNNQGEL